jgi:cobalt-zinc-cadmium efflux system outer membrane protein
VNRKIAGLGLQVWLALALTGSCAAAGERRPPDDEATLSLADAVQRTLDHHPSIRAAAVEVDIERARRDLDAQSPPLAIEAGVEDFAGTGVASGIDNAEITLQLSQVLERGDKSALRAEVGARRVDLAVVAADAGALDLARETTARYLEVVVLQERVALAREAEQIASRLLDFVQARAKAGSSTRAEASFARVEQSRAELARLRVDNRLDAARRALASQWLATTPDFGRTSADIYQLPALPAPETLERRLESSPALLTRAAELRVLQAQERLANAAQETDVSVSGGVRHLGEFDDVGFVFSVSVPFGSASRALPRMTESDLQSELNPLLAEAQMIEVRTMLSGMYSDLQFAEHAVGRLQAEIIPEAKTAVRLYEDAYRIGGSTLFELTQARKELLTLQEELVDVAGLYHAKLMEVEYLLGTAYEVQP